ncbi:MAG: F0F1 ATP synthase subunit B [Phycisphaerae bacterium]|nr:F0F1 ATP synthase subunit B [Phycisphaerae bacterium]
MIHPNISTRLRWVLSAAMLLAACPAAAMAAEHGGGEDASLFGGSIWTAVWALLIFVVLLVVLGKFAWKPVVKILEDREQKIATALEESEANRKEALTLLEQYRKQLEQAQAEAVRLMQQAQAEGEKVRKSIVDTARTEADDARKRAVEQIEASKNVAVAALFSEAATMAAKVAGQILQREIRPEEHRQLVEQALADMGREKTKN